MRGKSMDTLCRRTDDKVDLRPQTERQELVAHEVVHLDGLDDSMVSDALGSHRSE